MTDPVRFTAHGRAGDYRDASLSVARARIGPGCTSPALVLRSDYCRIRTDTYEGPPRRAADYTKCLDFVVPRREEESNPTDLAARVTLSRRTRTPDRISLQSLNVNPMGSGVLLVQTKRNEEESDPCPLSRTPGVRSRCATTSASRSIGGRCRACRRVHALWS